MYSVYKFGLIETLIRSNSDVEPHRKYKKNVKNNKLYCQFKTKLYGL